MTYNEFDLKRFADEMSEMPEVTVAERFARLHPAVRDGYLAQVRSVARSDLLSHRRRSLVWGTERRLSAIHKSLVDAGR